MLGALRSGAWAKGPSELTKSSSSSSNAEEGEGNRPPALGKEGSGKKRGKEEDKG
jgi:hypothetical protein